MNRRSFLSWLAGGMVALAFPFSRRPRTITVGKDGDYINAEHACASVRSGDTIEVLPGYYESECFHTNGKDIFLKFNEGVMFGSIEITSGTTVTVDGDLTMGDRCYYKKIS